MISYVHTLTIAGAIIIAGAAVGRAAGDGGDPRVIGYEGFLSEDATPVTRDDVAAEFRLYSARDASEPVWSSGETRINVVDGQFAVALGDAGQNALGDSVWGQTRLYLEVWVEGSRLDGRQEVLVSPFAARAVPGAMFRASHVSADGNIAVGGALSVGSNASVSGSLLAESVEAQGVLNVGTAGNAGVFNVYGTNHAYLQWFPDRGARKGWIGYGGVGTQTLSVVSEGGELELRGSRVRIGGDGLVVGGRYFCPRLLVRCYGGRSDDHMTWVNNESECQTAGYSVEGAIYVLMEC